MYKQNINRKHHALIPAAVDEDELDATKFAPMPILSSPSSTSPSLLRFASAGAGAGAEGVDRSAPTPTASGPPGVATARFRVHGLGFRVEGLSLRFRG